MLCPDGVVTERAGLVLGQHDHLPRPLGEALEHTETVP
jgi:hypothetical protein